MLSFRAAHSKHVIDSQSLPVLDFLIGRSFVSAIFFVDLAFDWTSLSNDELQQENEELSHVHKEGTKRYC